VSAARQRIRRLFPWALALTAIAFMAWIIPIRDRCWDPGSPASTHVAVTTDAAGCVLHLRTGDVHLETSECRRLRCEPGLATTLSRARLGMLAALLVVYMGSTGVAAARWRSLLAFAGVDLPLSQLWRVWLEAQAGGVLLPGGIGGDALRIAAVIGRPLRAGEVRAPSAIVIASALLDRVVGLSLIAASGVALGWLSGGMGARWMMLGLAAVPLGFLAGVTVLRRAPVERIALLTEGRVGRAFLPVLTYVRHERAPRSIARACALSAVVALANIGVVRGFVAALGGAPSQERWVYVGTVMAFVVSALPAMPGAWGTAEATYVFFFGLAGLAAPVALATSLLFRLFWYISAIVGAILYVTRPSSGPAQQRDFNS
jgi:uncharacterized membrane protein YbhN (UPF0104 family)